MDGDLIVTAPAKALVALARSRDRLKALAEKLAFSKHEALRGLGMKIRDLNEPVDDFLGEASCDVTDEISDEIDEAAKGA